MDDQDSAALHWGREYWAWFGFWAQFVVLGGLAILGAWFASAAAQPGDDTAGLMLAVGALAARLHAAEAAGSTAAPASWTSFLFVDHMAQPGGRDPAFCRDRARRAVRRRGVEPGSLHNAGIACSSPAGSSCSSA